MYNSKKAQISDTLSWGVATIIIIIILAVPILLVQLGSLGNKGISFERIQDPIVTKSISGYLLKNYDSVIKKEIAKKEVSIPNLDSSIYPFLLSLARDKKEGWGVSLLINNKEFYEATSFMLIDLASFDLKRAYNRFYFKGEVGEVLLEFWMRSERGGRDDIN